MEAGLAFVHERLGGFAVVVGEPGVHVVGNFEVHAFAEFAGDLQLHRARAPAERAPARWYYRVILVV